MATKKNEIVIPKNQEEKLKSLEQSLAQIKKVYGEGSVMKLGETAKLDVKALSTGILSLDRVLGIGGLPKGRIIEIYGAESSGKTTIALQVIAEAQKNGGLAAFVDVEHALDPIYAKALGVDIEELLISQPDSGEDALEITESLVRSAALDVIVVDSVAALVPKAEIEGTMEESQVGLQARLMSKGLRKLTSAISKSDTVVIFINQIREKIGGFSFTPGPTTTTAGGRALKFFSTIRMEVKKGLSIKYGEAHVGNETIIKIVKNKVASPHREVKCSMIFGEGISHVTEVLDMALEFGICSKSGSWFSFGKERLGQGKGNVEKLLKENKELFEEIKKLVLEELDKPKDETVKSKKTSKKEEVVEDNKDSSK